MAIPVSYSTGTASVAANGTVVTGIGTNWLLSQIREGDYFWAAGLHVRILSVDSATQLTLAYPWPGAARTGAAYEVQFTPDSARVLASARQLVETLNNGNLSAIGGLASVANRLAYFSGPGAAALTNFSAFGRSLIGQNGGLGKFVASTHANVAEIRDMVGNVAQSSGVPTGSIIERGSNANGEYVRFADGTQICTADGVAQATDTSIGVLFFSGSTESWTFPIAFSGLPFVTGSVQGASIRSVNAGSSSSTQGSYRQSGPTTSAALLTSKLMAVGRWF